MARDFEKNSPFMSGKGLKNIAQSKDAQDLLALLQRDGGEALRQAAQAAASCDYEKVKQLLAPKLQSAEAEHLLKQLERSDG